MFIFRTYLYKTFVIHSVQQSLFDMVQNECLSVEEKKKKENRNTNSEWQPWHPRIIHSCRQEVLQATGIKENCTQHRPLLPVRINLNAPTTSRISAVPGLFPQWKNVPRKCVLYMKFRGLSHRTSPEFGLHKGSSHFLFFESVQSRLLVR